ncbi:MAG: DUF3048 domain-containing protein [Candidatus Roseilinea sp.]|uniref:DUF3048 domain-containing protein n=1 Tax=Candidatus Roseilinea sp. TaxID=2838777 RepID=UPI004049FFAA
MGACDAPSDTSTASNTPAFVPAVTIHVPTVAPSDTPAPLLVETPTPGVIPLQAATPTPDGSINPFTGLPVSDITTLERAPLLVKVANTAEVRPQSGLNSADVVVEHLTEGGITRFTALYLSNTPERVGSVRSCRLIDIELPRIFQAGLVCSGTSPGIKPTMRAAALEGATRPGDVNSSGVIISDFGPFECPSCPMFRTSDRPMPHNLFANTANAWRVLDERGKNQRTTFNTWVFDPVAPSGGQTATTVSIPYQADPVDWNYNAGTGLWERNVDGQPHVDAETGQTLTAANVIVAFAYHAVTAIQEDNTGAMSIQIQLWGQGPVKIARDGRVIDGMWRRPGQPGVLEFIDAQGNPIPLKPGNSWLELAPLDFPVQAR